MSAATAVHFQMIGSEGRRDSSHFIWPISSEISEWKSEFHLPLNTASSGGGFRWRIHHRFVDMNGILFYRVGDKLSEIPDSPDA